MQTIEYANFQWIDDLKMETIDQAKLRLWDWFEEIKRKGDGRIYDFNWDIETKTVPTELANEEKLVVVLRFKRDEV